MQLFATTDSMMQQSIQRDAEAEASLMSTISSLREHRVSGGGGNLNSIFKGEVNSAQMKMTKDQIRSPDSGKRPQLWNDSQWSISAVPLSGYYKWPEVLGLFSISFQTSAPQRHCGSITGQATDTKLLIHRLDQRKSIPETTDPADDTASSS